MHDAVVDETGRGEQALHAGAGAGAGCMGRSEALAMALQRDGVRVSNRCSQRAAGSQYTRNSALQPSLTQMPRRSQPQLWSSMQVVTDFCLTMRTS